MKQKKRIKVFVKFDGVLLKLLKSKNEDYKKVIKKIYKLNN
jgi:hypothetical protein